MKKPRTPDSPNAAPLSETEENGTACSRPANGGVTNSGAAKDGAMATDVASGEGSEKNGTKDQTGTPHLAGFFGEAVAELLGDHGSEARMIAARQPVESAPESATETRLRVLLKQSVDERQASVLRVGLLEDALEHRERQIEALQSAGDALFQNLDVDAVVRRMLDAALEILRAEAGSLQLYNAGDDTLEFRYVVGPHSEMLIGYAMPASQGIAGRVFKSGEPDLTSQVDERADFNSLVDARSGFRTESMMTVPVKRPRGAPLGVMQILNARQPGFDRRDLEVLQVLCAQTATAFETARLVEEARRAQIVNLLGDISHDIKNMLTPIQSGLWTLGPILDSLFADMDEIQKKLVGRAVGGDLKRAATQVRDHYNWILEGALEACDQVQNRTREIADTVKGEFSPPYFEAVNVNEVIGEVARPLFLVADKTNVHLHLDLDHGAPPVLCDRKQIYNALYNLVNNAIPETPSGGSVTIRTQGPPEGENLLLVQVEDTGRGIAPHILSRLFTHEAVSTKAGGTGLGTRIVAGIVKRHNGTIDVQSEEGQGTTFSIRLPIKSDAVTTGDEAASLE